MQEIPDDFKFCFIHKCPLHITCLRWRMAAILNPKPTVVQAVYPYTINTASCPYFLEFSNANIESAQQLGGDLAPNESPL